MARVTVEDCLNAVDNRFELVLVATKRARQIANGKEPLVEWENDKPTVVALREIAEGLVDPKAIDVPEQSSEELTSTDLEMTHEDMAIVPGVAAQTLQVESEESEPAADNATDENTAGTGE